MSRGLRRKAAERERGEGGRAEPGGSFSGGQFLNQQSSWKSRFLREKLTEECKSAFLVVPCFRLEDSRRMEGTARLRLDGRPNGGYNAGERTL